MLLTFTTSNRYQLFIKTLESLKACCEDLSLISSIAVFDDCSKPLEIDKMRQSLERTFPERQMVIHTCQNIRGHAKSMQEWYANIYGDFVFHCEDDWEFISTGCPIRESLDVLKENNSIGQVCFSRGNSEIFRKTSAGTKYWMRYYDGSIAERKSIWPRFSLNPGITRVSAIKKVGDFEDRQNFEFQYGLRWVANQFDTAYLARQFVRHLGGDMSAYTINDTDR